MEQLSLLMLLCFSMLIGSFFSGAVPLAFKLSDSKSRLLALTGSGILVGTALAIIIPEGIDALYAKADPLPVSHGGAKAESPDTETAGGAAIVEESIKTWTIGVSLVVGFVLMLLIDQFSIYQASPEAGETDPSSSGHNYTLANQDDNMEVAYEESNRDTPTDLDEPETTSETKPIRESDSHRVSMRGLEGRGKNLLASDATHSSGYSTRRPSRTAATKVTPTLGLVIHASADGIALGAAATTTHREAEMIIFLAIMLHKAPAAFSLVVFLLHRGLKHSTIRRHLLAFSLSAPLAALVTYFGLSQSGKEALRRNDATGIAMLFSAGTFLYVATVHVLPELVHNKLLSPRELMCLVGGSFLPLLLAQTV